MMGSNALTVAMMRRSFPMSRNFGPFRQSGSGIEPDVAEAREKAGIRFSQKAVVRSTRHWPDRPRASGSNAPEPTERPAHKQAAVIPRPRRIRADFSRSREAASHGDAGRCRLVRPVQCDQSWGETLRALTSH
jgi:hypothetical protein